MTDIQKVSSFTETTEINEDYPESLDSHYTTIVDLFTLFHALEKLMSALRSADIKDIAQLKEMLSTKFDDGLINHILNWCKEEDINTCDEFDSYMSDRKAIDVSLIEDKLLEISGAANDIEGLANDARYQLQE